MEIANKVKRDLEARRSDAWRNQLDKLIDARTDYCDFRAALSTPEPSFIFEIKRTSPTSDSSPLTFEVAHLAKQYSDGGAAAISVLTEPHYFAGCLEDLQLTRSSVELPLLRKDFITDRLQILEARAFGADAFLLIAALLDKAALADLINYGSCLSLDALVEIHQEDELSIVLDAGAKIIGVNNRNLKTMRIDLSMGAKLLARIPNDIIKIAESGINSREDVQMLLDAGADACLIGTSVVSANNILVKLRELTADDKG